MKDLFILRGVPGSGKSTFIKNGFDGKINIEDYTLSTDKIRLMYSSPKQDINGGQFINQNYNKLVFRLLKEMLENRMINGDTTFIDATNIKRSSISDYLKLADKYNYKVYILNFSNGLSLHTLLSRNDFRFPIYNRVPKEIIIRMFNEYQICSKDFSDLTCFDMNKYEDVDKLKNVLLYKQYPTVKKAVIFGDIHGCVDRIKEYFNWNKFDKDTDYYFVGDYLDRGKFNKETLEFLIQFSKHSNVHLCEGNHERHLRTYVYEGIDNVSSKEFKNRTYEQIKDISKEDIKKFLKCLQPVYRFTVGEYPVIVNHAGISSHLIDLQSAKDFIKGVGKYEDIDKVMERYQKNYKIIQVCGHREAERDYNNFYNLNTKVEEGEPLKILTLQEYEQGGKMFVSTINRIKENKDYKGDLLMKDIKNNEIIEQLNNSPLIKKKYLDNGIVSYNFTRDAFYKKIWNNLTCKARGLFIDSKTNKIIARSYDKFFDLERYFSSNKEELKKFKGKLEISYKENGYLGLLSYNPITNGFFIATKSVDYGDYKEWFKDYLMEHNLLTKDLLHFLKERDITLVFEVIMPDKDSHIIEYDKQNIILLDAIKNEFEFKPYKYEELKEIAKLFNFGVKEIVEDGEPYNAEELQFKDFFYCYLTNYCFYEGYVIRDENNRMVKIKTEYYKKWKNVRNYLQRIANNKLSKEDLNKIGNPILKQILTYAMDNYKDGMTLIEFRKKFLKDNYSDKETEYLKMF